MDVFDRHETIIKKQFGFASIEYLTLNNVFDVYLTQDTSCSVTIEGIESIVNDVSAIMNDSVLKIENNHTYSWLNPKENKIKLYINVKSLKKIQIKESCNIKCINTIKTQELGVIFECKLAEANLNLDCESFYYWNNRPCGGKLTLTGKTKKLNIWNYALMSVDAKSLENEYAWIDNHAKGDCWVKANGVLKYGIYNTGNIYYYGTPITLEKVEISSSGKLINAN